MCLALVIEGVSPAHNAIDLYLHKVYKGTHVAMSPFFFFFSCEKLTAAHYGGGKGYCQRIHFVNSLLSLL